MGTCIAFFVVIGDLLPLLVIKLFGMEQYDHASMRRWLIIIITVVCIIPLSFQKNIQSLQFVCKASIAFYICLTIKTVFESFTRFSSDEHWSSNIVLWNTENLAQCIPIFSMALSCQMQLFEIYENITSFDRIRQNIFHATSICFIVYSIIGFFGYVAFYNQTLSGNVLVHFTPSLANDIITLGFIMSLACSFPLVIFPCRTSLSSLIYRKVHHSEISPYVPETKYKPLTLFIIISTMILGILVPSVEVIIGFVGSTIGTLICIIFPATCFVKIMQRSTGEKVIAQIMIVVGFVIMILGTYSNLNALDSASSGSHLEVKIPATVKLNEAAPILHPNDIVKIVEKDVELPVIIKDLPSSVLKNETDGKKNEEKAKNEEIVPVVAKPVEDEIKISADSIKKEEQEIAAAVDKNDKSSIDPQLEIKEKDKEIKELKASKDKLEQEVKEMKEVFVLKNQETQQLVLQKFEEIAEKVDKIEKQSLDSVAQKDDEEKKPEAVEVDDKKELIEEHQHEEVPKAPVVIENHVETKDLNASKLKEYVEKKLPTDHQEEDPIVKLIKSQEPLSYQIGEKMMEEKKQNATASIEKEVKKVEKVEENQQESIKEVKKKEHDKTQHESLKDVKKEHDKTQQEGGDPLLSPDDIKNEMRRKRSTNSFEIDFLSNIDPLNVQLKSMINRDLKSLASDDNE